MFGPTGVGAAVVERIVLWSHNFEVASSNPTSVEKKKKNLGLLSLLVFASVYKRVLPADRCGDHRDLVNI